MTFYQSRNLIIRGESKEKGNLWLGDYESARSKKLLRNDKIFTIITAGLGMKVSFAADFKHKILPLHDSQTENIQRFFEESYKIIDESLSSGNVLVHCYAGVSRSATITAAYLMKKNSWSVREALSNIKRSRPVIGPNKGFIRQLNKLQSKNCIGKEEKLEKTMSAQQNESIAESKKSVQGNFVQRFLNYKRGASLASKNIKIRSVYPKSTFAQRSKSFQKELLVSC